MCPRSLAPASSRRASRRLSMVVNKVYFMKSSRVSTLRPVRLSLAIVMIAGLVGACGLQDPDQEHIEGHQRDRQSPLFGESVFGEGGLRLFGDSEEREAARGSGIGVNSFLWRASLDTVSFMPLSSADPFGGVIITDWYAPPDIASERFKLTVYILGRSLRADGLKVALFRQARGTSGEWVDAAVDPVTVTNLENRILERARQLRTATASN